MPTNWAPIPSSAPLLSDGRVRITSGAGSASSWVTTGPGSLILGVSSSLSVPWIATLSQSREPVGPSIRQTQKLPLFSSTVVRTTEPLVSSRAANAGSEGWEPRSNATLQSSSGDCSPNGRATTVGSSFVVSTAAIISSGEPSSDRSASNGCVTDSGAVQVCALSIPMRKSASDHDHNFSFECPETVQPDSSHVMSGDQRSTSSALSES